MIHYRLGNADQAKTLLARLPERMKQGTRSEDAKAFLKEGGGLDRGEEGAAGAVTSKAHANARGHMV